MNSKYPQTMAKIATPSKSQRTVIRGSGDSPDEMPSGFGCNIHEIAGRVTNQMIAAERHSPPNLFPI